MHPVTSMATLEADKVIVQPYSTETIKIKIKAPNEIYHGVSVAGIVVQSDIDSKKEDAKQDEIEIDNRISYLIALQIRMSEVSTEMNLNYISSSQNLLILNHNLFQLSRMIKRLL